MNTLQECVDNVFRLGPALCIVCKQLIRGQAFMKVVPWSYGDEVRPGILGCYVVQSCGSCHEQHESLAAIVDAASKNESVIIPAPEGM